MAEHTPGPWRTTLAYDDPVIVDHNNTIIAIAVLDSNDPKELETIVANARLIAAAPELLAALNQVLDVLTLRMDWQSIPGLEDAVEFATEVINKAEGRSE